LELLNRPQGIERLERFERAAVLIILYPFAFILYKFPLVRNPSNLIDYEKFWPSSVRPSRQTAAPARQRFSEIVRLIDQENIVITVYEPDPEEWESDFKRRKT